MNLGSKMLGEWGPNGVQNIGRYPLARSPPTKYSPNFVRVCVLSRSQVIVGQSIGLLISTAIADVFTAQSFSFVLILSLMLFGELMYTVLPATRCCSLDYKL